MKGERDRISARIRALLAKTVENGCTEKEGIAAAAKAAEMLARYNLTVDEVQLRESKFRKHSERHEDIIGERIWLVADAIAHLVECRYWRSPHGVHPVSITFFGFDHEVEIALYLMAICRRALHDGLDKTNLRHRLLRPPIRRSKATAFIDGMVKRLAERIRDLKPAQAPGTGLIVLKTELIDAEMKREGLRTFKQRGRMSRDFDDEFERGRRTGDRVSLNQGLEGASKSNLRLLR